MKNVKLIATGGVITALLVVLLLITQFLPSGRIAISALCGIIIYIVINNYGIRLSVYCYVASGILSMFIVADKTYTGLYVIVFGLYSLFKYFIEKFNKVTAYILKTFFYIAEAILIYFLYKIFVGKIPLNIYYVFVGGYIVFLIYDIGINQFYSRIMNYLPKNK